LTIVLLATTGAIVALGCGMGVLVAPVTGITAVGAAAGAHAARASARITKNVLRLATFENFGCFISFSIFINQPVFLNPYNNIYRLSIHTDKRTIWIYIILIILYN
jgi:hypothetical protein